MRVAANNRIDFEVWTRWTLGDALLPTPQSTIQCNQATADDANLVATWRPARCCSVDGRTVVRAVDTGWQQQTCCCQRCAISNCCYSRCSFVSSRWRPLIAWFRSTVFARRRPSSVRRRTPGWSRRTARRSSTAPRTALSTTTASASTTTIRVRSVSSSCRPSSVSRSHRAGPSTKWVLHDLIRVNLLISEMLKQACYSRSFAAVSLSQFSPISQHCAYSWRVTKLSNNMALDIPVKTSVYSWSSS